MTAKTVFDLIAEIDREFFKDKEKRHDPAAKP